ncbi:MAG: diguanylate cyclase [Actinomycetota bacterium]|nr:diguanylate cyclase [Actinomycetota bacterium]
MGERLSALSYTQARRLLLASGLAILLLTALIMLVRKVETAEVVATLLFIPIFLAFVFWGLRGGVGAAVLASVVYIAIRYPAMQAVGVGPFIGLIVSRSFAYLAFGLIGGGANEQLQRSLTKLELYDQIDDASGLYNARFFLEDTDLEMSRSARYQTIFSIALIDIPSSAFEGHAKPHRIVRELAGLLKDSVRTVDRAVHGKSQSQYRFAVVLPETGPQGARVFAERLADNMVAFLGGRGIHVMRTDVTATAATFPDDEAAIAKVREGFADIDRLEHPEANSATAEETTSMRG